MNNEPVLLLGAGAMAIEYAKVLQSLDQSFLVIGRSEKSAQNFKKITGQMPYIGGLKKFIDEGNIMPKKAIVAVSEDQLGLVTLELLKLECKSVLVEKPGGANFEEIKEIYKVSQKRKAAVYVAYNRRFYESVYKSREIIKKDGGLLSFNFDFTEISSRVVPLKRAPGVKENWFLHNSTHVIDLAFFLGGKPAKMCNFISGSLPWHKTAAIFAGSGITKTKKLFSYCANWKAPGRWSVEFFTSKHKILLRPLEKIQIQELNKFDVNFLDIDDKFDIDFKPGLYNQVRSFLDNKKDLCTIKEQSENLDYYKKILGV